MDVAVKAMNTPAAGDPWRGFVEGRWQSDVDVRDFI